MPLPQIPLVLVVATGKTKGRCLRRGAGKRGLLPGGCQSATPGRFGLSEGERDGAGADGAQTGSATFVDPRRERDTERSGVARALETKFLRFRVRQRQDSVPSRSLPFAGTTGLVRFALPTGSTAQPARQDWRGLRRRFPDERRPISPAVKPPELSTSA